MIDLNKYFNHLIKKSTCLFFKPLNLKLIYFCIAPAGGG